MKLMMDNKCHSNSFHGVEPQAELHPRSHTEENLAELISINNARYGGSLHSSDLEWDDTFVSADELECRQLLGILPCNSSVR